MALSPVLDGLMKTVGEALVADAAAHKADLLAAAKSVNQTAASLVLSLVEKALKAEPALAPYTGVLLSIVEPALPNLVAQVGNEEAVLFDAVIAHVQGALSKL